MSQVARLDALVVDKAKTDLLGSISHELRSPLHGVLGGVEMLSDTDIDPFQNEVLHTIETCGKTLLDTMDHLLDFAKINNFSTEMDIVSDSRGRKGGRSKQRRQEALRSDTFTEKSGLRKLFADVELDLLVEEVVESVCAGHQFFSRNRSTDDIPPMSPGGTIAQADSYMDSRPLAVVLDLDYEQEAGYTAQPKDWTFHMIPGGFRRILMNIFGNALKYTDRGSVCVSISTAPRRVSIAESRKAPVSSSSHKAEPSSTRQAQTVQNITLKVKDTGRGISPEFLDNHLFLPFTQEDRLNQGTGLGLSIAQQIVQNMNGTINARSEVGLGTEFTVTLPLVQSTPVRERNTSDSTQSSSDEIGAAKGLRIALVGFTNAAGGERAAKPRPQRRMSYVAEAATWSLPRAEIEHICRAKLAMEVLASPSDPKELAEMVPRPELLLTTDEYLDQLISDLIAMQDMSPDHVIPPIVALCPSIAAAKERTRSHDNRKAVVDFISQPCGPRKLAAAFALSLMRWSEQKASNQNADASAAAFGCAPPDALALGAAEHSARTGTSPQTVLPFRRKPKEETMTSPTRARDAFLLVEDNPINMRILVSFMRKKNLEYDTAENGLVALQAYKQHHTHYRMVLMDISMPVMTGLEASREIRKFERESGVEPVTIVALTALASEGVQQEAFASGIDLFMTKPVRLKELERVIDERRGSVGSYGDG